MNILKNVTMVRGHHWKMFLEPDVPKISRNLETLQTRAKHFKNTYRSAFLVKLQALNLQIYLFVYLCLHYVSQDALLYISSPAAACTFNWAIVDHLGKQGWIIWFTNLLSSAINKKKGWHGNCSVKVNSRKHGVW